MHTAAPAAPILTRPRIARLFKLCQSPLAASRAADRVWRLAERVGSQPLRDLADALHEQRHVLRELRNGDLTAAAKHSETVGFLLRHALRV